MEWSQYMRSLFLLYYSGPKNGQFPDLEQIKKEWSNNYEQMKYNSGFPKQPDVSQATNKMVFFRPSPQNNLKFLRPFSENNLKLSPQNNLKFLRSFSENSLIFLRPETKWIPNGQKLHLHTLDSCNSTSLSKDIKVDESFRYDGVSKDLQETQTCLEEVTADNIICKLCGEDQDEAEVVSSTVGSMYQLELKSPGLYRCQRTGIKFLVKGPVIIEYKLDSWSEHLKDIPDNSYEILGPLFNIQTSGEPDAVSAVYLPHYLCLKAYSEDKALIKCAHFRDGNMTLETPTQIKPFYITLENPTFSCLGPILSLRKKKTPIHGSVLIYFTILCPGDPDEKHRIHLYVLPYDTNAEEILDNENKKFGFQRIKKPEHTNDTVYTKVKYIVTGHPGVSARPKALKFQSQPYQFTEIQLQEKVADISLNVCEENSEDPAWDAHLTQHDIRHITQSQSWLTFHEVADAGPLLEHFVDRHREALIQRTSNISPVLDNLLKERLLTLEQYDTLRGMTPHQEAMRQLYVYMKIWGQSDKEKFYKALKTHNEPLIRDLENPVIL